jgi:nucleotide-binding universal stress UspA family protein
VKLQTILVPTDFPDDAGKALTTAMKLASVLGATITVMHAYSTVLPVATPR